MYDIIANLVNHVWDYQNINQTQQQLYTQGAIILIVLILAIIIDSIFSLFHVLNKKL